MTTTTVPTTLTTLTTAVPTRVPNTADPDFVVPERETLYALMHKAMRRDAPRLVHALDRMTTRDRRRPEALARWFERFEGQLHHHHEVEDEIFWPALRSAVPAAIDELDALEAEHGVLTARLSAVHHTLDTFAGITTVGGIEDARHAAFEAAAALEQTLVAHLDREELTVFPALMQFNEDQYRDLETRARKYKGSAATKHSGGTPFAAPWIFESATDEEFAHAREAAPAVLFVLYKLVWRRRYERIAAILEEV
jgi:hemerythrin-like domain-containing protein